MMHENGCLVAVKYGRVGNRGWGLSMRGKKGGLTLAQHAPPHLQEISKLGVRKRQVLRVQHLPVEQQAAFFSARLKREFEEAHYQKRHPCEGPVTGRS